MEESKKLSYIFTCLNILNWQKVSFRPNIHEIYLDKQRNLSDQKQKKSSHHDSTILPGCLRIFIDKLFCMYEIGGTGAVPVWQHFCHLDKNNTYLQIWKTDLKYTLSLWQENAIFSRLRALSGLLRSCHPNNGGHERFVQSEEKPTNMEKGFIRPQICILVFFSKSLNHGVTLFLFPSNQ